MPREPWSSGSSADRAANSQTVLLRGGKNRLENLRDVDCRFAKAPREIVLVGNRFYSARGARGNFWKLFALEWDPGSLSCSLEQRDASFRPRRIFLWRCSNCFSRSTFLLENRCSSPPPCPRSFWGGYNGVVDFPGSQSKPRDAPKKGARSQAGRRTRAHTSPSFANVNAPASWLILGNGSISASIDLFPELTGNFRSSRGEWRSGWQLCLEFFVFLRRWRNEVLDEVVLEEILSGARK